jgi:hypothetical protein
MVWTNQAEAERQFATLKAGGVDWVREDLPWRLLEPVEGVFDWESGDALMAAAANRDMKVAGILTYSPPWASSDPSGRGDKGFPPRDTRHYARFARAVAERYGAGGRFWRERPDLDPQPLRAVELWNEPNHHGSWRPEPDPRAYARLASEAARAVGAVAPDVQVLMPGDVSQHRADYASRPWLSAVLAAEPGLSGLIDAYTSHPYPGTKSDGPYGTDSDPRSYSRVPQIAAVAADHRATRPIWITEIGWNADPHSGSVNEAQQAEYIVGAARRGVDEWDGLVARTFIYSWGYDGWGLRRADGSTRPAWDALRGFMAELHGRSGS